jgi:hypothetical protein
MGYAEFATQAVRSTAASLSAICGRVNARVKKSAGRLIQYADFGNRRYLEYII